jgi:hypothetical protein
MVLLSYDRAKGGLSMDDLERSLRAELGDANFEDAYRSAFGRLRADRYGDYPLHSVTLRMVQDMVQMQEALRNGEEPSPRFMPFGAPGVPTPEPDSLRISKGSSTFTSSGSNNSNKSSKSGGCYIATAVYGSYDCPQVWTLRRYRDFVLASKWYGRLFIRSYYAVSPTLVMWFGNTVWFKRLWRHKLDKFVNSLQQDGIQNTPYID